MLKKRFKTLILITNGRSTTQRNKIKSLNIKKYFNKILISDEIGVKKVQLKFYEIIFKEYSNHNIIFIGDRYDIELECPLKFGNKQF